MRLTSIKKDNVGKKKYMYTGHSLKLNGFSAHSSAMSARPLHDASIRLHVFLLRKHFWRFSVIWCEKKWTNKWK